MSEQTGILNKLFSIQYSNVASLRGNIILEFLYRIAHPSSVLFAKLSIKPNTITFLSLVLTVMAFLFIISSNSFYFVLFWIIAVHLDFCDGTVARMTNNVSKTALRLDHLTDILKVCLIFLGVGIWYDNSFTWILVCISLFAYLFYEILSHEMKYYSRFASEKKQDISSSAMMDSSLAKKIGLNGNSSVLILVVRNIHSIVFNANAHTLFLFCLFPLNVNFANNIFIYFSTICFYGATRTVISLHKIQR